MLQDGSKFPPRGAKMTPNGSHTGSGPKNGRFWVTFGSSRTYKSTIFGHFWGSTNGQDVPPSCLQMPARCLQVASRWLKLAPSCLQLPPRSLHTPPRCAKVAPSWLQVPSKRPQDDSKWFQHRFRTQKWTIVGPKSSENPAVILRILLRILS